MLRRRIVDANKGRSVVPVLRYFVVMGCCLLGLLFGIDYLVPKEVALPKAETATVSNGGTLASWRQSQEKLEKPAAAVAVVYPAVAPLPPTAERLQWERQLTFRKPDRAGPSLQARAELPTTAAEAIARPAPPASSARVARPRGRGNRAPCAPCRVRGEGAVAPKDGGANRAPRPAELRGGL